MSDSDTWDNDFDDDDRELVRAEEPALTLAEIGQVVGESAQTTHNILKLAEVHFREMWLKRDEIFTALDKGHDPQRNSSGGLTCRRCKRRLHSGAFGCCYTRRKVSKCN